MGPRSAGADRVRFVTGRGGVAPTITDCNLVLGLSADPGGLIGGELKLDRDAATPAIVRIRRSAWLPVEGVRHAPAGLATMRAIRAVSVERGRDRGNSLLAFGGNGPLLRRGSPRNWGLRGLWCRRCRRCSALWPAGGGRKSTTPAKFGRVSTRSIRSGSVRCWPGLAGGAEQLTRDGFLPGTGNCSGARRRPVILASPVKLTCRCRTGRFHPRGLQALFGDQHERIYGFRATPPEEEGRTGRPVGHGAVCPCVLACRTGSTPLAASSSRRRVVHGFAGTAGSETPVVDRAGLSDVHGMDR